MNSYINSSVTVIATVCLMGLSAPSSQAETCWQISPGPTRVEFKVKHLVFLSVDGKFKNISGCIDSPGDGFEGATAQASIKVGSISTGNKSRDKHLRSEDFFYVEKYPEMTFKSDGFTEVTENGFELKGQLTIREYTHPVTLQAQYMGERGISGGRTKASFKLTGSINRFDYGLRWSGLDEADRALVGDIIDMSIKLVLIKVELPNPHGKK